jgi:hypothetical protein
MAQAQGARDHLSLPRTGLKWEFPKSALHVLGTFLPESRALYETAKGTMGNADAAATVATVGNPTSDIAPDAHWAGYLHLSLL